MAYKNKQPLPILVVQSLSPICRDQHQSNMFGQIATILLVTAIALANQPPYYDGFETMVALVNKARADRNLPPVCVCRYRFSIYKLV